MQSLKSHEISPVVRIANYFQTRPHRSCWADRIIPDPELILIVSGRFEYLTPDGLCLSLRPGHVLLIEPGVLHTFRAVNRRQGGVISCIHFELMPGMSWASGDYRPDPKPRPVMDCEKGSILFDLFRRAAESFEGYGRYRTEIVASIVRAIWLCLSEKWTEPADAAISVRMEKMVAYLRQHLFERVTRNDLAKAFFMTPEHVNYLFRKDLNTTPTEFVQRERVLRAYTILHHSGLSVKETAAKVGFADPFHFSRVFKKVLGISPSAV